MRRGGSWGWRRLGRGFIHHITITRYLWPELDIWLAGYIRVPSPHSSESGQFEVEITDPRYTIGKDPTLSLVITLCLLFLPVF